MSTSFADLRQNYTRAALKKADLATDPMSQFRLWFEQALAAQIPQPNAMTIASATPEGKPSARMVLLKDFDERGFVFYTNYNSNKGKQLAANPWVALVFWWIELERQVRIEGQVEKISAQESDAYFYSRPRDSQLGALASPQSQVIPSREALSQRLEELNATYANQTIPRPENWGGFRVKPTVIEFWQGRPNRLHDRLRYRCNEDGSWLIERLAP